MKTNEKIIGSEMYLFDEIESTNQELLQNSQNYTQGSLVVAKKQTAGRGRQKREWKSDTGGLYFSFILKDQSNIKSIYPMVLFSALAVTRCITSCSTQKISIKWPNDVYVNHRKVCGILAESVSLGNTHHVVIGLGINVNNPVSHLEDLRHPAVSLKECYGKKIDRIELLERIIEELNILYQDFTSGKFADYLPELNRNLYSKDSEIEIFTPQGIKTITPLAFTAEAKLLCIQNGEKRELFMGEF